MNWLMRILRISRALRGPPERGTPIAELVEGRPVRIVGVAQALGPLLTSPVDSQPCLGFRLLVERRPGRGGSGEAWSPVLLRQECESFWVRDETGLAIIEKPMVLKLDVDVGGWAGLPPEMYALLDEARVSLGSWFRDYEFRFSMALLKVGDRISVEGRSWPQIDPAGTAPSFRSVPVTWHFRDTHAWPIVVQDVDDLVC